MVIVLAGALQFAAWKVHHLACYREVARKQPCRIRGYVPEVFVHVLDVDQDFGIGIPDAEQERIFEPFHRVDKSRVKKTGGYGLGLSLCREIMQAHGGEIALQSRPGGGTTFMLKFPKQHMRAG
jgi:signal transduction histidine kinase